MSKFTAVVKDPVGLHARPASIVVAAASKFASNITIHAKGKTGNLKSIMNIMALGIKQNEEITIEAAGADADAAIAAIKTAMEANHLI